MLRRRFLFDVAAAAGIGAAVRPLIGAPGLTHKERVDRALAGRDVDRPPFTLWHHFGLKTPEEHATRTLEFHKHYRTDIVKVMSDFPYPVPEGKWYEVKPLDNPFPQQVRALELIRDGLHGDKYFIETLFNPWNVAEKLSSKGEVEKLKVQDADALLHALDIITTSQISHAKRALGTGASGILLAVANANAAEMSPEDYARFSAPFDKRILEAVSDAKMNVLHLHVERPYLDQFHAFPPAIINYSLHVSGIPISEMRKQFPQAIMGGIDEVHYRTLTPQELRQQWQAAQSQAGSRFILTPGCSVPNDSTEEELERLPDLLKA